MSGLESLPDASTVAQIVIAATGESPDDLRIVDRGVTAVGWRVEAWGGPYCVLIGLPPQSADAEYPGAAPQFGARAAVLSVLREREVRCPEVLATSQSAGIPERLRRWPWMVTNWMGGEPLPDASAMTPALAREVGQVLAALHAIPVLGYGPLADRADEVRGTSDDPAAGLASHYGRLVWPFDGRPLATQALVQAAPDLVLRVAPLREQLLAYAEPGERAVCHLDLSPGHIWTDEGVLAGLLDFGDVASVPPALEVAEFAYIYGWTAAEELLGGYATNSILREIRLAEAHQLGVLVAIEVIDRRTRIRPDARRRTRAIEFLRHTLPHAMRRTDA